MNSEQQKQLTVNNNISKYTSINIKILPTMASSSCCNSKPVSQIFQHSGRQRVYIAAVSCM